MIIVIMNIVQVFLILSYAICPFIFNLTLSSVELFQMILKTSTVCTKFEVNLSPVVIPLCKKRYE
jgi:hypothetical protein